MGISPYFAGIRAAVGNELLLIPGASVLPWDAQNRVLLVRNEVDGPWGLLGGAIEPDESPQEAAVREALEEVGVQVELTNLRAVLVGPNFDSDTKMETKWPTFKYFLTRASLPVSHTR